MFEYVFNSHVISRHMKTIIIILLLPFVFFSEKTIAQNIPGSGSVTDIDGNTYRVIAVGNMLVMDENLRVTRYQNGDSLLHAPNSNDWLSSGAKKGAYAYFNNVIAWAKIYGSLYNYAVVKDARNICPAGWRIPNNEEWKGLADAIRSTRNSNSSFFVSPPNVFRFFGGNFEFRDKGAGVLWSSSPHENSDKVFGDAWGADFTNLWEPIKQQPNGLGLCIRCIRNMPTKEELAALQQTITDKNGTTYRTVQLGKQTWMAEDLRTTVLNDGTPLNNNKTNLPALSEAGKYNFWAVNTQKLCPAGWKIPSLADWNELIDFYGGDCVAGAYLAPSKDKGSENPFSPSLLNKPDGIKIFWTATLCGNNISAETKILNSYESRVNRDCNFLDNYLPVRCIKGEPPLITQKPKTLEEWKKENKSITYTPGSKDVFPDKWPEILKNPAKNIGGYYTTYGCGCNIKEVAENEIEMDCHASNWTGKKKDYNKSVFKEYTGTHTVEKVEFRNLIKPGYYLIDLGKNVILLYYPDSKKFELHMDNCRAVRKNP